MTLPVWPDEFPLPNREGYQGSVADGRISWKPDYGAPRTRRRTSAAAAPLRFSFDATPDGLHRFKLFWAEDTSYGALPFMMRDWELDGWTIADPDGVRLLMPDGRPLRAASWRLMMFASDAAPTWDQRGNRWRVAVAMVIMP